MRGKDTRRGQAILSQDEAWELMTTTGPVLVAAGPPSTALTPESLARAYGGHVHVLGDGTVVLDEPHHHDHRYDDQLRG